MSRRSFRHLRLHGQLFDHRRVSGYAPPGLRFCAKLDAGRVRRNRCLALRRCNEHNADRTASRRWLSPQQIDENTATVRRAWRLHYDHCRHSLVNGYYQGWDLHPAQLPTRYAAVYTFFLEGLDAASERLRNFLDKAAQATLVGDVFDDAATGQGLLNYFLRAINCGAITEEEATKRTSITLDDSGRHRS